MTRWLPRNSLLLTFAALLSAEGNRTTPPTLNSVSPFGVARGTTAELTVEGLNLAKASAIYFSRPGVKGRILRVKELPDLPDIRLGANGTPSSIDLGPLPPRIQVTVEVEVSPDADIGPVSFRLLTPLGTSPEGRFLVEPYYGEAPDREPNDTPETAFETILPAILSGTISKPGDVDYYQIKVEAGQLVTFENGAMAIGSTLQPVVTILDANLVTVREFGAKGGVQQRMFAYRFERAGLYYIKLADYQESGDARHFYRIIAGEFPLALGTYPLGVRKGTGGAVALKGYKLNPKLQVSGKPESDSEDSVTLRPQHAFNEVRIALGDEPELNSQGGRIPVPVTVNGRIPPGAQNDYRFEAHRGDELVLEVNARRLGSELDSYLEVLDADGNPIERAVVRPVWETSVTLRDHDSAGRGIRISTWDGLRAGDYVMAGGEIIRVEALPLSPDNDTLFASFGGQRLAFFDTTTEMHAIDSRVYKVQIFPPGTKLLPNGLPVAHLYHRNDDGGPGYGQDSVVHFTAPADGQYIARIRDVQGLGGENYAYRLTVRKPHPDFRLSVNPRNPNVPVGGTIPVTVTAFRMDGFEGPITVSAESLPPGIHATPGVIAAGQTSTTIALSADSGAKSSDAVPFEISGKAEGGLMHAANPEDHLKLIALMPAPDLVMTAETKEVSLAPGGKAEITVSIARQGDFKGRVPVEVRSLPPYVRVLDVGLNGVLITEGESRRSFTIEALPMAQPADQMIYVSGNVETRSNQQSIYAAPQPIHLRVK